MAQYYKLQKKIAAGAQFIITQLGYDARKFEELSKFMDFTNLRVPVIGNIFVLSASVGRIINQNMIPGGVVTDRMLSELEAEKKQAGSTKNEQLTRAAKLYGLLKGLGYSGVNIGGPGLDYSDICFVIEKGEEYSLSWKDIAAEFNNPQRNGFYFFKEDKTTGLNMDQPVDRIGNASRRRSLRYALFSMVHKVGFDEKSPLYPVIKSAARLIDNSFLKQPFTYFEYIAKKITNDCQFCGNCVMHELGFICPMSQCPKQQRNGACGGSRDGWCEVYPGKQKCIYVKMYPLMNVSTRDNEMAGKYLLPCNWDLYRTSSWLNFFNGRDPNCKKNSESGG